MLKRRDLMQELYLQGSVQRQVLVVENSNPKFRLQWVTIQKVGIIFERRDSEEKYFNV